MSLFIIVSVLLLYVFLTSIPVYVPGCVCYVVSVFLNVCVDLSEYVFFGGGGEACCVCESVCVFLHAHRVLQLVCYCASVYVNCIQT